jgi:hypothetical protein
MSQLASIRALYGSTMPTKEIADTFCFYGNSICNGFSADFNELPDVNTYCPDSDIAGIYRYDGIQMKASATIKLLNRAYNKNGDSSRFGNETMCCVDLKSLGTYSNNLYIHCYTVNGTSIISGETPPNWSPNDAGNYFLLMVKELDYFIRLMWFRGVKPCIRIVNFACGAINDTVEAHYLTAMNDIITGFRTKYSMYNNDVIPFVWDAHLPKDEIYIAKRNAVLNYSATYNDNRFTYFDLTKYIPLQSDNIHFRTMGQRSFGQFVASCCENFKNGNHLPTVSGITLVGTLVNGHAIGADYTFSDADGDAEGTCEVNIIYANDVSGTNPITLVNFITRGQTFNLSPAQIGKYIKLRVVPVALTGALHGINVESAWLGPVTA